MTRDQIQAIVIKHLHEIIPETAGRQLDLNASLADLHADSLDLIDVASRSMQELSIKVPRAEMGRIRTFDDLLGLLHRTWEAAQAAKAEEGAA